MKLFRRLFLLVILLISILSVIHPGKMYAADCEAINIYKDGILDSEREALCRATNGCFVYAGWYSENAKCAQSDGKSTTSCPGSGGSAGLVCYHDQACTYESSKYQCQYPEPIATATPAESQLAPLKVRIRIDNSAGVLYSKINFKLWLNGNLNDSVSFPNSGKGEYLASFRKPPGTYSAGADAIDHLNNTVGTKDKSITLTKDGYDEEMIITLIPTGKIPCGGTTSGVFCDPSQSCLQKNATDSSPKCVDKGSLGPGDWCRQPNLIDQSKGNPDNAACSSGSCSNTSFKCVGDKTSVATGECAQYNTSDTSTNYSATCSSAGNGCNTLDKYYERVGVKCSDPTRICCVKTIPKGPLTSSPTPTPGGVGGPGGGGGGATVAPPQKPSGGFCADSIRKNAMALETPAACDPANIDNNTELVAGTGAGGVNKWCDLNHHAGSYFYRCTNSSSNPTPGVGGPFNPATVTNKGLSCSGTSVIIRPSYTPGNAATYIFAVWKDSPPPGPTEFTTNTEYTVASPLLDGSHTIYFDIMSCPEGTNELNPAHNPHCSYSKNGIYSIGGQELKDQATTCAAGTGGGTTPPAGAISTPAPTPSGGGAATGSVCNSNNNFACSNSSAVCSIHWDCTTTSQQSLPHGCCATGRWCPSANACVSFGTPCAACAVANTTPGATGTGCAAPNPNVANRGYDCPDVYHSGTCGGGMTCQAEVGSRTGCTCQPGTQIYPTETPRPGTATPTPHTTPTPAPVGPSGATCVAEGNSGRCGGTEVDPRAYTSWGQVPPCTNGQYCWVRN